MRRHRKPAAILPRPAIGVPSVSLLTIRGRITGAPVDDREVAHYANLDLICDEIPDRDGYRRLFEKTGAVDKGFVGVGAVEILRKDLVEALDVRILHRRDVVAVEHSQFVDIL